MKRAIRRPRGRHLPGCFFFTAVISLLLMSGCAGPLAGIKTAAGGDSAVKEERKQTDSPSDKAVEKASVGILYTKDVEKGNSLISWRDEKLEQTGKTDYDFTAAYYDGFRNSCEQDGLVYLYPRGDYVRKDGDKLAVIDTADGSCEQIDIGLSNVTGYAVEGDTLCFSSNENHKGKVSVTDLETRQTKSMDVVPEGTGGALVFDMAIADSEFYGMALDDQLKVSLLKFDIENSRCEKLLDLPDADTPGFLQVYGRQLLFISDGQLARFDLDQRELTRIDLKRPKAFNLNLSGDKLLIGYTDVLGDSDQTSLVEVRDIKTMRVLASTEIPEAVMQLEMRGDDLYVLGYEELRKYVLATATDAAANAGRQADTQMTLTEQNKIKIRRKGYDVGGLMITRGSGSDYGGMSEEEAVRMNEELFDKLNEMPVDEDG